MSDHENENNENDDMLSTGDEYAKALDEALDKAFKQIEAGRDRVRYQDYSGYIIMDVLRGIEESLNVAYHNGGMLHGANRELLELAQRLVDAHEAMSEDEKAAYRAGWEARSWDLLRYLSPRERRFLLWRLLAPPKFDDIPPDLPPDEPTPDSE